MLSLAEFKKIVEQNLKVSKVDAESIIIPILKEIPVPETTVSQDAYIERAVKIHKGKEPFELTRLSYIPEELKHKVEEGRFNRSSESIFYGALTDFNAPELTRYFLACEIEQNLLKIPNNKFSFTTTKWWVIRSFPAIVFIFDAKYCSNNLIKEAFDAFQANPVYLNLSNDKKEVLKLITIELAKPKPLYGYLISNIIFDFYKKKGFYAIIYPGVQSLYQGTNIALVPKFVDKYLVFFIGAEFELIKNGSKILVDNKYAIKRVKGKLEYYET